MYFFLSKADVQIQNSNYFGKLFPTKVHNLLCDLILYILVLLIITFLLNFIFYMLLFGDLLSIIV